VKLDDVLDLVTIAYEYLRGFNSVAARHWVLSIERIFREENVHYRVEPTGAVRFYIDEAFAQARASTIAAISAARYANVLAEFEKAMAALAHAPPDGKASIRGVFAAVEGLFLLIFPDLQRLSAGDVSRLKPVIELTYNGDRRAQTASKELLESLRGWIDAAHNYRHEEGKPDAVAQPPLTLAVYLIDSGSAHLRWLAELDSTRQ
jgi:hypothetical protein